MRSVMLYTCEAICRNCHYFGLSSIRTALLLGLPPRLHPTKGPFLTLGFTDDVSLIPACSVGLSRCLKLQVQFEARVSADVLIRSLTSRSERSYSLPRLVAVSVTEPDTTPQAFPLFAFLPSVPYSGDAIPRVSKPCMLSSFSIRSFAFIHSQKEPSHASSVQEKRRSRFKHACPKRHQPLNYVSLSCTGRYFCYSRQA